MAYFYRCHNNEFGYFGENDCLDDSSHPSFSTAGLGGLPTGVKNISPKAIGIDKNANTVVILDVLFQQGENELCKTVNNLLGDLYQSDDSDDGSGSSYYRDACWNYNIGNGIIVDTDNMSGVK